VKLLDISVVIPYYKALDTIGLALESIVNQTLCVKEVIVVDDFSNDSDALLNIIEGLSHIFHIEVIHLTVNSGASAARNHGARVATGKYLAFLDSDDVWHPNKIKIQYELMEIHQLNLSGHLYVHDLKIESMVPTAPYRIKYIRPLRFVFGNPFFTPTIMVKREGFIEFDHRYRRVDDYKCWLMNVKNRGGVLISTPLAGGFKPAIGSSGLTSSYNVMHDSYLTVLKDMRREGDVNLLFFISALVVEYLKYPIRIARGFIARFLFRDHVHNSV
jgi:glycosyltransferase involved in cell wall biosynthesis